VPAGRVRRPHRSRQYPRSLVWRCPA
jgi:hypothetical protein